MLRLVVEEGVAIKVDHTVCDAAVGEVGAEDFGDADDNL